MKAKISKAEIAELYSSGHFDADWYRREYPDVNLLGMDPAEHYLWIGRRLGRAGSAHSANSTKMIYTSESVSLKEIAEPSGFRSINTFNTAERSNFLQRLRVVPSSRDFFFRPNISVLVPAYKSPIKFLDMAVKSVVNQSYRHWELIVVDDGSNSVELAGYLNALPVYDSRIRIQINDINRGISSATNDALALSNGEFVALFDHDDIMTLDALERYVSILNEKPGLDLIYSDECRVDESDVPIDMFRKPDWSSAMLQNYMYTGHLSVYRRSIVERVGGFRSQYDFSQDYDLALRVTELTDRIHHIPELLYGWRAIAGSGAAGGKDFARESNIAALQDAMRRRGIAGKAVPLPTANRIDRRGCIPNPLVSIIIPSDNPKHISQSIDSIFESTEYRNYEIIIVTNSGIIQRLKDNHRDNVRFVAFDQPFNFSAKCNAGARQASGEFFCFFNDDVRPRSRDWIEALLEQGLMSDVGAVGSKLLYENNTIQHAGMITGVRNLIGTAFHCLPEDTSTYFNMAQCVRDVTLLCGALILMRRGVFQAVGGWDERAFAIAHSDTDLCLKVWNAGLRCVYTPHASLVHIGHVSIGVEEAKEQKKKRRKEKGEIALLRRWPNEIAQDRFFPYTMVRSAYHDAQEYFRIYPGSEFPLYRGRDILIVCHELTQSGAPAMALEMAIQLKHAGHFVSVIAPCDGPMSKAFTESGITVVVDELLFTGHETVKRFCVGFDVVISNTIVTWPLVCSIMSDVCVKWYIHESDFLNQYISDYSVSFSHLSENVTVWAVTSVPERILKSKGWKCSVVTPGITAVDLPDRTFRDSDVIEVVVLGGYEPRKGQDLALAMLDSLPGNVREKINLKCFGRIVDLEFYKSLCNRQLEQDVSVSLNAALSRHDSQLAIRNADIVLVPSRDESFSLVVVEALQQGSIVVCSEMVGAAEFLENGKNGFVAASPSPTDLASSLQEAVSCQQRWPLIREAGAALARDKFSQGAFRERLLNALADALEPAGK
jgi:O-antigen biosynthesis protein